MKVDFNKSTKQCEFLGFCVCVAEISILLGYAVSHPRRMETSDMKHFLEIRLNSSGSG
jgi:hypothetical protein